MAILKVRFFGTPCRLRSKNTKEKIDQKRFSDIVTEKAINAITKKNHLDPPTVS